MGIAEAGNMTKGYLFPAVDEAAGPFMRCLSYTPPKRSKPGINNNVSKEYYSKYKK